MFHSTLSLLSIIIFLNFFLLFSTTKVEASSCGVSVQFTGHTCSAQVAARIAENLIHNSMIVAVGERAVQSTYFHYEKGYDEDEEEEGGEVGVEEEEEEGTDDDYYYDGEERKLLNQYQEHQQQQEMEHHDENHRELQNCAFASYDDCVQYQSHDICCTLCFLCGRRRRQLGEHDHNRHLRLGPNNNDMTTSKEEIDIQMQQHRQLKDVCERIQHAVLKNPHIDDCMKGATLIGCDVIDNEDEQE